METRSLYLFYRSLGSGKFQSLFSVFLKPISHYFLYRNPELFPLIFKRYISKFNYERDGFWISFHIGIQHMRPLLTGSDIYYLRGGEDITNFLTKKFNHPAKFINLKKYKNKYLNFIKFIKNKDKIVATCSGRFGIKNKFIQLKKYQFFYSNNLIELAFQLNKECYFEIFYFNNFLNIKRKIIKLSKENYQLQIKELISFLAISYPHNLRKNRFIINK